MRETNISQASLEDTKPVTSHGVLAFLAASMLGMAAFMFYCVFAATQAPKDQWDQVYQDAVESLMDFHRSPLFGVVPNGAFAQRLESLVEGHPFSLHEAHGYRAVRTQIVRLNSKNLILAKFHHPNTAPVTVGIYPLQKRQLPKTEKFTHEGFLFYSYDKGLAGKMIATNFYNDFYVMGLGEHPPERLATLTLDLTNLRRKAAEAPDAKPQPASH